MNTNGSGPKQAGQIGMSGLNPAVGSLRVRASVSVTALLAGVLSVVTAAESAAQSVPAQGSGDTVVLAPIAIDAKADVITGGVQLDAEDVERTNPQTLRDVLRQEPGVKVGSPVPISQKIYVNGIEDTNLNVDIDGARQANKTYHHIGTTIIDPGMLKAVKIESGVAPADAGPRALAGSISLETKEGRDLVMPGNMYGGFGKLTFNSNTESFDKQLAGAVQMNGFDGLIYGQHVNGRDYEDGNGDVVEGTRPDNSNIIAKLGFTADNGYRFKISATRFDDVSLRDGRMNFNVADATGTAFTDYSRESVTVAFGDETPTAMWDPKASLSRTFTHLTADFSDNTYITAWVESYNGKAQNTFTTAIGKVTSGFDFFIDTGTGSSNKGGGGVNRDGIRRTEREHDYGLFTQVRTDVTDDLRTSVGGRFDYHRLEGNDDTVLNNTGLSGNVNGEYDFTDNLMGYAGASTVFGGVPMTEVGIQGSYYDYSNVDTSRSYNGKIGANYRIGDFTFDGNVYKTRIKNAHDLTSTTRSDSYNVESTGLNVSARYDYDNGFMRAGFSKTKFRVDSDIIGSVSESYLGVLLGDMLTFEAHHRLPDYNVQIGTTNEFAFENDDTVKISGAALNAYFLSNVYAEWKPEGAPGLTLRADVRNLLDRRYSDRSNIGQYSTAAIVTPFYEPGRTVLVSAKFEF